MRPIINNGTKTENTILMVYLAIEFILLIIGVATYEMEGFDVCTTARYGAIALNAVIALVWYIRYGRPDRKDRSNLLAYGLFTTLIADYFLTWLGTEEYFILGFTLFCIVQLIYAVYLRTDKKGYLTRLGVYIAALIGLILSGQATVALAIGLLDIILILANAVSACTVHKNDAHLLFRIGIILFFLCDISIVICNVTDGSFSLVVDYLTWAFYAPSQVIITLAYVKSIEKR